MLSFSQIQLCCVCVCVCTFLISPVKSGTSGITQKSLNPYTSHNNPTQDTTHTCMHAHTHTHSYPLSLSHSHTHTHTHGRCDWVYYESQGHVHCSVKSGETHTHTPTHTQVMYKYNKANIYKANIYFNV